MTHSAAGMLSAALMAAVIPPTWAQDLPNKVIRIVTAEAGGGNDLMSRLIANGLTRSLGQAVIVENRVPVAVVGELVAKAAPDGSTLLSYGSNFWFLPFMRDNVPYDPIKDFAPITLTVRAPNVLVVHPSLPVRTVKELIALARARPGELNYSSGSLGSASHLSPELFKSMARVNIAHIPYKGTGQALNAVIAGQVQIMFPNAVASTPHVKSGRLRALAITTLKPSPLLPGLQTISASGLPGYEAVSIYGVFAPAKTPPALINRFNREIVHVLETVEVKEKIFATGAEVVASTPEAFAAAIKADMELWGKVIREAGVRE